MHLVPAHTGCADPARHSLLARLPRPKAGSPARLRCHNGRQRLVLSSNERTYPPTNALILQRLNRPWRRCGKSRMLARDCCASSRRAAHVLHDGWLATTFLAELHFGRRNEMPKAQVVAILMQLTLPDHEQLVEAVRRHGLPSSSTSQPG